jgi:hypothetical protein
MELDIQSRMYAYVPNKAPILEFVREISPHIKSYARLMKPASGWCSANNDDTEKCFSRDINDRQVKEKDVEDKENLCKVRKEDDREGGEESKDEIWSREESGRNRKIKEKKIECSCVPLAWCLLTSACLSKGSAMSLILTLNPPH